MAVVLKTASIRVSFIQIMQVRVQNKGKSVCKSRYVGDVSMCDASNYVGAVLGQRVDYKLKVIHYASKTLDSAQQNYATTEKRILSTGVCL